MTGFVIENRSVGTHVGDWPEDRRVLAGAVAGGGDEADLSARVTVDQLGHARPSMTQDVYTGRKVVDARVAEALEDALGKTPPDEGSGKKA